MVTAAVATATSPLWFTTRATGITAFVLLTGTVLLGILTSVRFSRPAWPRFVTVSLHRNLSLLTITFTALHVLTTVTDPFAAISVVSVVVPFTSAYRPIWLSLGTISFDLLLAVLVTSLLRTRIRPRTWRAVHWAVYACWPVALVHGLGTGTDGSARWVLAVTAACVLAVAAAGVWRLTVGWPAHAALRVSVAATAVILGLITAVWAWIGPLSPGWARRAGTPLALLARSAGGTSGTHAAGGSNGGASSGSAAFPAVPFQAQLSGTVSFSPGPASGDQTVTLAMSAGGTATAVRLRVVISGPAVEGGVEMKHSRVTLGPPADPSRYAGQLLVLDGSAMRALVTGAGQRLSLAITITGQTSNTLTATLTTTTATSASTGTNASTGEGGD